MTWAHVMVIIGGMGLVVVCGANPTCNAHIDGVLQLATVVVGGALGHASHASIAAKKEPPTP